MGFNYFPQPDNPELQRGPSDWAKELWIEDMPYEIRKQHAHFHHEDICICVGAAGTGKSWNTGSRGIYVARKWPRGESVIGAMNGPQLERNQTIYWRQRFAENGNGDPDDWGGRRMVRRKMTDRRKFIELPNSHIVHFLNFELWATVVGLTVGFVLVEEANNLRSIQSYEQLLGRVRHPRMPLHQIILLANPRIQGSWMYDKFNLRQFRPDYQGNPLPIGKPCRCQYCPVCLALGREVEWVDGECPECKVAGNRAPKIQYCRQCRSVDRKLVKYDGAQCPRCGWYKCPGDQNFHRFMPSNLGQNQFADEGLLENMRSTMSAQQFKLLGEGKILDCNTGAICTDWNDSRNIGEKPFPIDYEKDIQWCSDFNTDPMTVVLAQKYSQGNTHLAYAKEEIVYFRGIVRDTVVTFNKRHPDYKGKIIIWGDPSGFQGGLKDKVLDRFEQLCNAFEEFGYEYELHAVDARMSRFARLDNLNYHCGDGNGIARLIVNPNLTWTIESIRGTVWDKTGTKEDETNDKWFRTQALEGNIPEGEPDPEMGVRAITHLQAALGYWLNLEYPQVNYTEPVAWHREPDGTIVQFNPDKIVERPQEWYEENFSLDDFNPARHTLDGMIRESMGEDLDDDYSLGSLVKKNLPGSSGDFFGS